MQIEPIFLSLRILPAWFINFLTFPLLEGLTFSQPVKTVLKGVFYVTNYRPDLDGLSCGHCVKRVKESLEQPRMLSRRMCLSLKRTLPGLPCRTADRNHQTSGL